MDTLVLDEFAAVEQCRTGRREAFEPIVNRYKNDAYRIALGLVGSHDDAMELTQEAFYRAFRHLGLLRRETPFFPWFYQILRNLCFTHLRRSKLRHTEPLPDSEGRDSPAHSPDFSPDVLIEQTETKQAVWKAIGQLPDKHREIIILRHFQNLTYEQIAQHLFCNTGTVMSRLYHARKRLREILEQQKGVQWI